MSSHVWVSSLKNIYSSSSIYNNTSRDFKSDWIMTPIQQQIIRKYTPLTHVRECKAPWPFLQDKTTPLHMNALIWKGKSSRKMKGKKKNKLKRECVTNMWPSSQVWSTFKHIRKEEHHDQWAVLSGISPTEEKECTKDMGEDKEIYNKKKEGARWEGETLVVVW